MDNITGLHDPKDLFIEQIKFQSLSNSIAIHDNNRFSIVSAWLPSLKCMQHNYNSPANYTACFRMIVLCDLYMYSYNTQCHCPQGKLIHSISEYVSPPVSYKAVLSQVGCPSFSGVYCSSNSSRICIITKSSSMGAHAMNKPTCPRLITLFTICDTDIVIPTTLLKYYSDYK